MEDSGSVFVVMQVLADRHRVTASVVFQAAVNRGHQLLQTLDSITYIPRQALALPFIWTSELAGGKVAAATIWLFSTSVNGTAGVAISVVTTAAGAVDDESRLVAVRIHMAAAVVLGAKVWRWLWSAEGAIPLESRFTQATNTLQTVSLSVALLALLWD